MDRMQASHPYDRMRIVYSRQKHYPRHHLVCQPYLDLPDREHRQDKEHFQHRLEHLEAPTGTWHISEAGRTWLQRRVTQDEGKD